MKALIALSLAASASATALGCAIPEQYVINQGTQCAGPREGYRLFGVCIPGGNRAVYSITAAGEVRTLMGPGNLQAFTANPMNSNVVGCMVPNTVGQWGATPDQTQTGITSSATLCVDSSAPIVPTDAAFKGVEIRCDRANGFFPSRGFEGTGICVPADGLATWATPVAPAVVPPADYFNYAHVWEALDYTAVDAVNLARGVQFTGNNSLVCTRGCTLPVEICSNGRFHANIVSGFGAGFLEGTCTIAPQFLGVDVGLGLGLGLFYYYFQCRTAYGFGETYRGTCNVDPLSALATGTPTFTPAYTGQCGGRDGAQTNPIWNFEGRLDHWTGVGQAAGAIVNFPTVTSTLIIAYQTTTGAYFTGWRRDHWNNNGVQEFNAGNIYEIVIEECSAFTGAQYIQCVQQTLNWWRCYYDFPFYGGTICWYDYYFPIPCPTHDLGFRCPTSSKKGLLGLLGLLGLIPLFLLCCCLLFCCCIRRRKTEADVHFATFDPHAAPVIATAPCATATACPTAFGATPFATHASAIPCL